MVVMVFAAERSELLLVAGAVHGRRLPLDPLTPRSIIEQAPQRIAEEAHDEADRRQNQAEEQAQDDAFANAILQSTGTTWTQSAEHCRKNSGEADERSYRCRPRNHGLGRRPGDAESVRSSKVEAVESLSV